MTQYMWLIDYKKLVRKSDDVPQFEWYNPLKKEWIPDWNLSILCTGEVWFDILTEEEAWKKLESLK